MHGCPARLPGTASVRNLMRAGVVYCALADPSPRIELTMLYRDGDTSPVLPRFLETVRAAVQVRQ